MELRNAVAEAAIDSIDRDVEPAPRQASRKRAASQGNRAEIDLSFIGSKEELAETRSVTSRVRLRSQLGSDIERFLAQGGAINKIAADVTADPPKKPESKYGSRAI